MSYDDLISTGDNSDYDILEKEKDYISKNDFIWVKTKQKIWRGRVLLIPYSKKRGSWIFENKMDRYGERGKDSY